MPSFSRRRYEVQDLLGSKENEKNRLFSCRLRNLSAQLSTVLRICMLGDRQGCDVFRSSSTIFRFMFVGVASHYGEIRLPPYMRHCELHHYGGTLLCCQRDDLDWQDTRL
jgi:hypothetical protein